MKKLLSITLAATMALGSMNLQAGDKITKASAYFKIAGGIAIIARQVLLLTTGEYFKENLSIQDGSQIACFNIAGLSLSTLLIQSGLKDLKKLKKQAEKKKAQEQQELLT